MNTTRHGEDRMKQRGIPPLIVEACISFGREYKAREGGSIYRFDKRSRRHLERAWGRMVVRRLSDLLDTFVVLGSDGTVITTGKCTKRLKEF
jgi:hypothetical protein